MAVAIRAACCYPGPAKPLWEGLMKLPHRRQFLHLAAGAAALPALSHVARAQAYPTRPVRMIVSVGPAGGTDIMASLIGQWLSERLGQQFIIENRPGAGTNLGTEAVVRAPADGYTLLMAGTFHAINATLYDKLSFDFIRDIAPVAPVIRLGNVLDVNLSVPAKTIPEFIAYAKANPGKINMASNGSGSTPHVTGELFKMMRRVFVDNSTTPVTFWVGYNHHVNIIKLVPLDYPALGIWFGFRI